MIAIVFRSLVAAVKSQPAVDVSVEIQAVKFLQYVDPHGPESANAFLSRLASSTDESLTDFVQCIVVLISSASEVITMAAMKTLKSLFFKSSPKKLLALVKAGLIPELVINLNPQSLSSPEAVHTHTYLLSSIAHPVRLTTPYYLSQLEIIYPSQQQAIYETSLGRIRQEPANASNCFFLLSDHKHCLCVIVVDSGIISWFHYPERFGFSLPLSLPRKSPHSPSLSPPFSHCSNCSEMEAVDADDWQRIVFSFERRCDAISEWIHIDDHRRLFGRSQEPRYLFIHTKHSLLTLPLSKREEEGGTEAREAMRSKRCRTCIAPSSERSLCTPAPPHTDRSSASPSTGLDSICLGDGDCVLTLFPTVIVGCWLVVESMAVSPSTHHRPSSRLHKLDRNLHVTEQTGREHANADCQPSLRLRMRIASHPLRHTGTELWTQTIDNDDTTLRDRDL
ncbi:hypothetical protein BLNAU_8063 [Blattamonas nauphoetae]|uniref:Uncharacterized protein n=1 Tax=Blattamonas nauphoetae TaxID=2049346 RepID=A0ABQ9XZQ7_9EUKA|nr:hypothetical protein BLNAU_8063 [Blattamonas nauphoetae]